MLEVPFEHRGRLGTAIAVLGTAGSPRRVAEVLSVVSLGEWIDEGVAVLADRSPTWVADLPAALLTGGHLNPWRLVRAMVRAGLAGRLDIDGLILASGPALHRAEKGIVRRQLKLLGLALKAQPESAPLIRDVITPALVHERPEVREAARAFASRLPAGEARHRAPPAQEPALKDDLARREDELRSRAARLMNGSPWAEPIQRALAAVDSGRRCP